jgi:hypothetical protein
MYAAIVLLPSLRTMGQEGGHKGDGAHVWQEGRRRAGNGWGDHEGQTQCQQEVNQSGNANGANNRPRQVRSVGSLQAVHVVERWLG